MIPRVLGNVLVQALTLTRSDCFLNSREAATGLPKTVLQVFVSNERCSYRFPAVHQLPVSIRELNRSSELHQTLRGTFWGRASEQVQDAGDQPNGCRGRSVEVGFHDSGMVAFAVIPRPPSLLASAYVKRR